MVANNETGVVNDLPELASTARSIMRDIVIHTDATQAVGRIPCRVDDLTVDLLSLSAHKFGGPQGVGALYVRRGTSNLPIQTGGGQESGRRAGTLNVAGIVGLGAAARLALTDMTAYSDHTSQLRNLFESEVLAACPEAVVIGEAAIRLPNTSLIAIPGAIADAVLTSMPLVAASHGSACAAGALGPSQVLRAMGVPDDIAECALRFSFGPENTGADARTAAAQLTASARRIRGLLTSPLGGVA
jgi:cysteine desulfurase